MMNRLDSQRKKVWVAWEILLNLAPKSDTRDKEPRLSRRPSKGISGVTKKPGCNPNVDLHHTANMLNKQQRQVSAAAKLGNF
jgi:hypothetical protein